MHKPDPRTRELTIEAAGGDPRRAVMVGDSKTDVDTAKNAGAPVVAVDFGYTDIPVAELAPDRVISHFDELWAAAEAILPPSAFGRT
jgi:phosphoglycolate phosphatase